MATSLAVASAGTEGTEVAGDSLSAVYVAATAADRSGLREWVSGRKVHFAEDIRTSAARTGDTLYWTRLASEREILAVIAECIREDEASN